VQFKEMGVRRPSVGRHEEINGGKLKPNQKHSDFLQVQFKNGAQRLLPSFITALLI
jgi:hypothetical protein